jgi:hypothetical protein
MTHASSAVRPDLFNTSLRSSQALHGAAFAFACARRQVHFSVRLNAKANVNRSVRAADKQMMLVSRSSRLVLLDAAVKLVGLHAGRCRLVFLHQTGCICERKSMRCNAKANANGLPS